MPNAAHDNGVIQAAIFDLDGTLCDSLPDIAHAANEALKQLGLAPQSLAAYRQDPGNGINDLLRNALTRAAREVPLPRSQQELTAELLPHYEAAYGLAQLQKTRLFEGVAALLDKLTGHHIPLAILSNKGQADVSRIVTSLLGRWPFVEIVGHRPGVPKKPNPTAALRIAATLGSAPENCLYVGDTSVDAEAATRAGMIAVGVSWGFHSSQVQRDAGAQCIAAEADDIWQWYGPRMVHGLTA